MPKKKKKKPKPKPKQKKPKQNLQSEHQSFTLIKFALKNVVLNEFLLILFHYLMSTNCMKTLIGTNYQ
jgi:hypothetical protein